jgi:hypothetical protein
MVELMVTLGIVVIIGGILARFLILGGAAWHSGDAEIQAVQEARKGMMAMTRELRQTSSTSLKDMSNTPYVFTTNSANPINYNSIVFSVVTVIAGNNNYGAYGSVITNAGTPNWSAPITYYVNKGQLIRLQNNATKVLANDVTGLTFCLQNISDNNVNTIPPPQVATLLITLNTTVTTAEQKKPGSLNESMTLTSSILLRN